MYLSGLSVAGLGLSGGGASLVGTDALFGVTAGRVAELYADARPAASLAATADRENSGS